MRARFLIVALATNLITGLLVTGLVPGAPESAFAAPDDAPLQLDEARAEARRIEAEIEELGSRASVVLEEYRLAQARLAEADTRLLDMRARVERLRRGVEEATTEAEDRLVSMYQGRGTASPMSFVDAQSVVDLGVRHHYAQLVARRDRQVVDELSQRQRELETEERQLEVRREEVAEHERAVRGQQEEVEAAMAAREDALAQAEGEVASLVEEEQQRRQAEEELRLREELARQEAERRAAEARRATTTSSTAPVPTTVPITVPIDDVGATTTTAPADPPTDPPADVPPVHPNAQAAVDAALSQIGVPYEWGGNGPDSYDCSGLTTYAWSVAGVRLPRSSRLQKAALPPVPLEQIQPGDLLFFGSPVHHVGLYVGGGEMVNAPYTGTTVRINSIYRRDLNGIGRPG